MYDVFLYLALPLCIGLLIIAFIIRPRRQQKKTGLVSLKVVGTTIPATNGEKPKDVRPGLQLVEHGE